MVCVYENTTHIRARYGAFAGREQKNWPDVERNPAGIPSLVLVGPDGQQLDYNGYDAIQSKGANAVDDWVKYTWD